MATAPGRTTETIYREIIDAISDSLNQINYAKSKNRINTDEQRKLKQTCYDFITNFDSITKKYHKEIYPWLSISPRGIEVIKPREGFGTRDNPKTERAEFIKDISDNIEDFAKNIVDKRDELSNLVREYQEIALNGRKVNSKRQNRKDYDDYLETQKKLRRILGVDPYKKFGKNVRPRRNSEPNPFPYGRRQRTKRDDKSRQDIPGPSPFERRRSYSLSSEDSFSSQIDDKYREDIPGPSPFERRRSDSLSSEDSFRSPTDDKYRQDIPGPSPFERRRSDSLSSEDFFRSDRGDSKPGSEILKSIEELLNRVSSLVAMVNSLKSQRQSSISDPSRLRTEEFIKLEIEKLGLELKQLSEKMRRRSQKSGSWSPREQSEAFHKLEMQMMNLRSEFNDYKERQNRRMQRGHVRARSTPSSFISSQQQRDRRGSQGSGREWTYAELRDFAQLLISEQRGFLTDEERKRLAEYSRRESVNLLFHPEFRALKDLINNLVETSQGISAYDRKRINDLEAQLQKIERERQQQVSQTPSIQPTQPQPQIQPQTGPQGQPMMPQVSSQIPQQFMQTPSVVSTEPQNVLQQTPRRESKRDTKENEMGGRQSIFTTHRPWTHDEMIYFARLIVAEYQGQNLTDAQKGKINEYHKRWTTEWTNQYNSEFNELRKMINSLIEMGGVISKDQKQLAEYASRLQQLQQLGSGLTPPPSASQQQQQTPLQQPFYSQPQPFPQQPNQQQPFQQQPFQQPSFQQQQIPQQPQGEWVQRKDGTWMLLPSTTTQWFGGQPLGGGVPNAASSSTMFLGPNNPSGSYSNLNPQNQLFGGWLPQSPWNIPSSSFETLEDNVNNVNRRQTRLENIFKEYARENENLRAQLQARDSASAAVSPGITDRLDRKRDSELVELAALRQRALSFESEKISLQTQISELRNTNERLQGIAPENQRLSEELATLRRQHQEELAAGQRQREEALATLRRQHSDELAALRRQWNEEKDNIRRQHTEDDKRLQEERERERKLASERAFDTESHLKNTINDLESERNRFRERANSLQSELDSARSRTGGDEKWTSELKNLLDKLSEQQDERKITIERIRTITNENTGLKADLEEARQNASSMEERYNLEHRKLQEAEGEILGLNRELRNVQAELESQRNQNIRDSKNNADDIRRTTEELERSKARIRDLEGQVTEWKKRADELAGRFPELERRVEEYRQEAAEHRNAAVRLNSEREAALRDLQANREDLRTTRARLEADLARVQGNLVKAQNELNTNAAKLREVQLLADRRLQMLNTHDLKPRF